MDPDAIAKKSVLFVCTRNSCRSQMAEGILRRKAKGRFDVASAGTDPMPVNPLATRVMTEVGVDLAGQRSKSLDAFKDKRFDYVITVCDHAKESCPATSSSAQRIHWSLRDPAEARGSEEERLKVFREVRDEIEERIESCFLKKQSA